MTVGELVGRLSGLDQDAAVVLSADEEGNDFNHAREVWYNDDFVLVDGEIMVRGPLTPELAAQGYVEDDLVPEGEGESVVVLWP